MLASDNLLFVNNNKGSSWRHLSTPLRPPLPRPVCLCPAMGRGRSPGPHMGLRWDASSRPIEWNAQHKLDFPWVGRAGTPLLPPGALHPRLGRKRGHTHCRNPGAGLGSQETGPEVPEHRLQQPASSPTRQASWGFAGQASTSHPGPCTQRPESQGPEAGTLLQGPPSTVPSRAAQAPG